MYLELESLHQYHAARPTLWKFYAPVFHPFLNGLYTQKYHQWSHRDGQSTHIQKYMGDIEV